jgi:hypothetical protein
MQMKLFNIDAFVIVCFAAASSNLLFGRIQEGGRGREAKRRKENKGRWPKRSPHQQGKAAPVAPLSVWWLAKW